MPPRRAPRLRIGVRRIVDRGDKPLLLGGDHSVTYPVLRGFGKRGTALTILHLDAHGDLYDNYEGDRYSHACPFARIMEEKLAARLVQVGVRTLTAHQRSQAGKFGVESARRRPVARCAAARRSFQGAGLRLP